MFNNNLFTLIMEKQIVLNSIQTPDGTILISHHVHDYVTHLDKNGEQYMVDGGTSYLKRSSNVESYKDLSVYVDDDFELVRVSMERGSRGINSDEPLRWVKLADMSDDHLKAVLAYGASKWQMDLINKEIKYRK